MVIGVSISLVILMMISVFAAAIWHIMKNHEMTEYERDVMGKERPNVGESQSEQTSELNQQLVSTF